MTTRPRLPYKWSPNPEAMTTRPRPPYKWSPNPEAMTTQPRLPYKWSPNPEAMTTQPRLPYKWSPNPEAMTTQPRPPYPVTRYWPNTVSDVRLSSIFTACCIPERRKANAFGNPHLTFFNSDDSAMEHCYHRWSPDKSEEKNQFCLKESDII